MNIITSAKKLLWPLVSVGAATGLLLVSGAASRHHARVVVGLPHPGENAWELIGRSDQDGPVVRHYGYLTHVFGLPDEALFSIAGARTEATARFTYFGTTTLTARHALGNIIQTAAPGALTIYFNPAPAGDFNDPDSFRRGQAVASFSVRYHNVLYVEAPDIGISSSSAALEQTHMGLFELESRRVHFGRPGLRARFQGIAQSMRTQADPLKAVFFLSGSTVRAAD
jgi:hypothetical protein